MTTKQRQSYLAAVATILALPAARSATAQDYAIVKSTIDGGGGTSAGGSFVVSGTLGQHDAGSATGGTYTLQGGFWAAAPCTCQLYGDVVSSFCVVDVDDLLCVLDDFVDPMLCAGNGDIVMSGGVCASDGLVDVDDLLAELDAFSGIYACPHPCAP